MRRAAPGVAPVQHTRRMSDERDGASVRIRRLTAVLAVCCLLLGAERLRLRRFGQAADRPSAPADHRARAVPRDAAHLQRPGRQGVGQRTYTPTLQQFVDHLYGTAVRSRATRTLTSQGLAEIAHIFWITDERIQNDLVLLRFATPDGAAARLRDVENAANGNSDFASYSIDARGAPIVYYAKQPDVDGNTAVRAYAQWNDTVVEMFLFSQTGLPKILVQRWLTTQVDRLP